MIGMNFLLVNADSPEGAPVVALSEPYRYSNAGRYVSVASTAPREDNAFPAVIEVPVRDLYHIDSGNLPYRVRRNELAGVALQGLLVSRQNSTPEILACAAVAQADALLAALEH